MADQVLERFIAFLEERSAQVRALEEQGAKALEEPGGQEKFGAVMRQKAELLAALSQDGKPLLEGLPGERAALLARKLKVFSAGASNSLRLNSVFYMSALLYPDDHRQGEPNNLDLFISELRRG